jgi:hypothetical protein
MAAKRELVAHIVTVGNVKFGVDQPVDDYTNIGDIVGVKKATADADMDNFQAVNALQRMGKVIKLSCRLKNKKTNTILCAIDRVAAAIGKLRGKTLAGSTIVSVTIPRRRSRR